MEDDLSLEISSGFKRKAGEEALEFKGETAIQLTGQRSPRHMNLENHSGVPSDSDHSSLTAIRCDETLVQIATSENTRSTNAESIQESRTNAKNSFLKDKDARSLRRMNLEIEVIDETALIQSPSVGEISNPCASESTSTLDCYGTGKKQGSRRRGRSAKKRSNKKNDLLKKKSFSFKQLLALRFADIEAQWKLWTAIYSKLGEVAAKEYDDLKKKEATSASILGVGCTRRCDHAKIYVR